MKRLKNKQDISLKVQNMKIIMESLFTENENKSITSILSDFKSNRSIQYLVDNIQPYIDTKVKLIFIRIMGEIIPQSHRERFNNYCISKGLIINKSLSDLFELKRPSSAYPRTHNYNSYFDYEQEDNELLELFDIKSTSSREEDIPIKRGNSNYRSSKLYSNQMDLTIDSLNSHHLFVCRLGRLTSQSCNSFELCLQTWGISWWRSQSTYSLYIVQVDETALYRRNDILEHDIRIGQRLKQINNREVCTMDDEEFLEIMENSMNIDLVLQGEGIVTDHIWENSGGDYKWIDCISDRNCHPPLNYTISMDISQLKTIELIKDTTQELGINIRGGREYSLGIYISSIRNGSVGSIIGLQPGDKLLQINSLGFTGSNIPFRNDALNMIHQCQNADLWIYSLNKLPMIAAIPEGRSRSVGHVNKRGENFSVLESKGMFHKGQRSQLTHTSLTQPSLENIESQISEFITKQDVNKILYLLARYENSELNVHQLVTAINQNMDGFWNTKLVNVIMNNLRLNDRMQFKMQLEIIQSLYEDKVSRMRRDSIYRQPYEGKVFSKKENEDNIDIVVSRRRRPDKQFSDKNDTESIKYKNKMDSLEWEFKDISTNQRTEFDQLEMVDPENTITNDFDMQTESKFLKFETSLTEKMPEIEESAKWMPSNIARIPYSLLPIKCPIPKDEILSMANNKVKKLVTVNKIVSLLGISIEGGVDTPHFLARIAKIEPNSCAGFCVDIKEGDIILEVNGIPLAGMDHKRIARKIAEAFKESPNEPIQFLLMKANNIHSKTENTDYESTYL